MSNYPNAGAINSPNENDQLVDVSPGVVNLSRACQESRPETEMSHRRRTSDQNQPLEVGRTAADFLDGVAFRGNINPLNCEVRRSRGRSRSRRCVRRRVILQSILSLEVVNMDVVVGIYMLAGTHVYACGCAYTHTRVLTQQLSYVRTNERATV